MKKGKNRILYVSYNLDASCFNVGLNNGYQIYNTDPLKVRIENRNKGEIGIVEGLFKTNLILFVGTEENDKYPPNAVNVWDEIGSTMTGMITYNEKIQGLKVRADKIIIMTTKAIHVVRMKDFVEEEQYNIVDYSRGEFISEMKKFTISAAKNQTVLAWTNNQIGEVSLKLFEESKRHDIKCHDNNIQALCLNIDGKMLATASNTGTIIRIWNTLTGKKMHEVRRGSTRSKIIHLSFSIDSRYLSVNTERGTVHIFEIGNTINGTYNKKSTLSFMESVLPSYFSSEWSFAKIYLNVSNVSTSDLKISKSMSSFSKDEHIVIITNNGMYYKYKYKLGSSQTKLIQQYKWIDQN